MYLVDVPGFMVGLEASYRSELAAAEDPRAKLAEIIDPRDTRRLLCEYAALCAGTMVAAPPSFGYRP